MKNRIKTLYQQWEFIQERMGNKGGLGQATTTNNQLGLSGQSQQQAAGLQNTQQQLQQQELNGSPLAQAQLTAATNQNTQQGAGMIESAKGLNPALAARLASQQTTQANQQAANQSAQLQAQIQMAARQQLANTQLAQQGIYQGAIAAQNQNSTQQQGQQLGFFGGLGGGAAQGIAGALTMADGGTVAPMTNPTPLSPSDDIAPVSGPQSAAGKYLKNFGKSTMDGSVGSASQLQSAGSQIGQGLNAGIKKATTFSNPTPLPANDNPNPLTAFAKGGKVPALLSPGEIYLKPSDAKAVAKGKENPMKSGEKIPGKPKVGGARNSYANDTVPKKLDVGGIVVPRSITQGPDAVSKAQKFVAAHIRNLAGKRKK